MAATALAAISSIARYPAKVWTILLIVGLLVSVLGCTAGTEMARLNHDLSTAASRGADEWLVVDCLLPGQIRKLGRSMIYLTPRRPIKTAAQDCEIRGGEYVAYDRSDYATALKVWLPQAKEGDKIAQTYVGEIYEKGLGVSPDYALAVEWYRSAAEQGYERAQINLGHLYEKGLGVGKDPITALHWYRQASGLREAIAIDPASLNSKAHEELDALKLKVDQSTREAESLRRELEQARQQLQHTQQDLEQRRANAEREQQQVEEARQELEERKKQPETQPPGEDPELRRLEEQLNQREAQLERQQQEIGRLRQEVARLEADAEQQRQKLTTLTAQQAVLAGPMIEMIDPPLVMRDETPRVRARSGVDRLIVGRVTAPAGLLTFAVNGREESLGENGLFRLQMLVQRSSTPVSIVAVDKQGKRAAVEFVLAPEEPSQPPAPPTSGPIVAMRPALPNIDFGNYHALIIGNQKYNFWPTLDTPETDAKKVGELLSSSYGFKTKLLINATRYDILQALNALRAELTEKDNLLIYYAGHGHLEEKIGRGYWIPVDGESSSTANWIPTFAISDILNVMSAKHAIVVADTCYAGALTRSSLARLEAGMSSEARYNWLKTIVEKRSRTALTSGDLKPVLDSGGGEHSIFARAFLDVLRENNDILEGQRFYHQIAARVAYAAAAVMTDKGPLEQLPQYAPIQFAGHESGDFLFRPIHVHRQQVGLLIK